MRSKGIRSSLTSSLWSMKYRRSTLRTDRRDTDAAQEVLEDKIRTTISEPSQQLRPPSLYVTNKSTSSEALKDQTLELKRLRVPGHPNEGI